MGGGISASLGCAPRGERQEKRSTKWQGCKKKEKIKLKGGLLLFGTASPSVENRFVFIGSGGEGGQNFSIDKRKRLERLVCGETVTVGVLFFGCKTLFRSVYGDPGDCAMDSCFSEGTLGGRFVILYFVNVLVGAW